MRYKSQRWMCKPWTQPIRPHRCSGFVWLPRFYILGFVTEEKKMVLQDEQCVFQWALKQSAALNVCCFHVFLLFEWNVSEFLMENPYIVGWNGIKRDNLQITCMLVWLNNYLNCHLGDYVFVSCAYVIFTWLGLGNETSLLGLETFGLNQCQCWKSKSICNFTWWLHKNK